MNVGTVYIFSLPKDGEGGLIKIGSTSDILTRYRDINRYSLGIDIDQSYVFPTRDGQHSEIEREIHKICSVFRVRKALSGRLYSSKEIYKAYPTCNIAIEYLKSKKLNLIALSAYLEEARKMVSSRENTKNVSAHLPPRYLRDLKRLAAEHDGKTQQDFMAEALDDLFAKYLHATSE